MANLGGGGTICPASISFIDIFLGGKSWHLLANGKPWYTHTHTHSESTTQQALAISTTSALTDIEQTEKKIKLRKDCEMSFRLGARRNLKYIHPLPFHFTLLPLSLLPSVALTFSPPPYIPLSLYFSLLPLHNKTSSSSVSYSGHAEVGSS